MRIRHCLWWAIGAKLTSRALTSADVALPCRRRLAFDRGLAGLRRLHRLIEAGARDELARRSLKTQPGAAAMGTMAWRLAFTYVRQLHGQFWPARLRSAYRIAA